MAITKYNSYTQWLSKTTVEQPNGVKMLTHLKPKEIADLAKKELPVKYTNLEDKVLQYEKIVFGEIAYGYYLANMAQIKQNQIPFNITRIRKQLGRYGKGGKGYWWDWLNKNFPLVKIIKKGNSIKKVNSMIEPILPLRQILDSVNGKDLKESLYGRYFEENDAPEFHYAPIDMISLENYIATTKAHTNLSDTAKRNLENAILIYCVAKECNNELPQVISHSLFGRTYYKGLNLQNVHKNVRHAALGRCYSIDIDSSVFNWKYAMLDDNTPFTYTRELIQDKERIRKRLAMLVWGNTSNQSISTIKRVLTAISFGAKMNTRSWFKDSQTNTWTQGAISDIIYSQELREKLFNDPWMQAFLKEQDTINKILGDILVEAVNNNQIPEIHLNELKSERGRISRTKLIAWWYQQSEQQLMQKLVAVSEADVLLQVHDGLYFRKKPKIVAMKETIRDEWPLASLSMDTIERYAYTNFLEDKEHEAFIKQEELEANNGSAPQRKAVNRAYKEFNPHDEPVWDQVMQEEYEEYASSQQPDFIMDLLNR